MKGAMMTKGRWKTINRWRRMQRSRLRARRLSLTQQERAAGRAAASAGITEFLAARGDGCVGVYWPFKAEIDIRHIANDGVPVALPVVVRRGQPLEFWRWRPGMALRRGVWDIPIPVTRDVVQPSVLLVPLLGFDDAGYRLGYGGGYYDRTLDAMSPRPLAIGLGFDCALLPTIHPQPHDIPMDAIITENGITRYTRAAAPVRAEPAYAAGD